MPKKIEVTLGGQEYEITALTYRKSKDWRKELAGPFQELVGVLQSAEDIELNRLNDIAGVVQVLSDTLLGAMDLIFDLLCRYAPAVAQDAERIEAEAYDEEILDAFVEVLKLAFPFGRLASALPGRTTTTS